MIILVLFTLLGLAWGDTCESGTRPPGDGWLPFWIPSNGSKNSRIRTVDLPYVTKNGYTIDVGVLGKNALANASIQRSVDAIGKAWSHGEVDAEFGYPNSTVGGFNVTTKPLVEDFSNGLRSETFNILLQKKSDPDNVDIVSAKVDGNIKNVLQLKAYAGDDGGEWAFRSGAIVQTQSFYASGKFEIRAKVPDRKGVVFSVWTFHYEEHYEKTESPDGEPDPQYVPEVMKDVVTVNHEIDWEIPASCSGLCSSPDFCQGQSDTSNLNTYLYGGEVAIANMCVRAPSNKSFADDEWHTYSFEWHAGNSDDRNDTQACYPKVNFFFDGEYVSTNDVYVPSRGSRLVFGIWGGNKNWVGQGDWSEMEVLVSDVIVEPFVEDFDAMYPQNYDQPCTGKRIWTTKDIPPARVNETKANTFPGDLA